MKAYKELAKKINYKPQIDYCVVRHIQPKQRSPMVPKLRPDVQNQILQNIGAQDPAASGTPINIVQKPNGKLAAEVSKPVPLGGRKPKPFNPKKLREYINKIKK